MIPANMALMRWTSELLKATLAHTDERTKLEGELVGGEEPAKFPLPCWALRPF
jgi:hypothetical protein